MGSPFVIEPIKFCALPCSIFFLLSLLTTPALGACDPQNDPEVARGITGYGGAIGEGNTLRLALALVPSLSVKGQYAFADSTTRLPVFGQLDKDGHIQLSMLNSGGALTATFNGVFPERDPNYYGGQKLQCELMKGTWTDEASGRQTPLNLVLDYIHFDPLDHFYRAAGAQNDEPIERGSIAFRRAVVDGRRMDVAQTLRYPIPVRLAYNGPARVLSIANANELLSRYDEIFTSSFRQLIVCAVPLLMFSRDTGIMLANGEVFFDEEDGKVIRLNNDSILLSAPGNSCRPR
jgi:hypothetical protein